MLNVVVVVVEWEKNCPQSHRKRVFFFFKRSNKEGFRRAENGDIVIKLPSKWWTWSWRS